MKRTATRTHARISQESDHHRRVDSFLLKEEEEKNTILRNGYCMAHHGARAHALSSHGESERKPHLIIPFYYVLLTGHTYILLSFIVHIAKIIITKQRTPPSFTIIRAYCDPADMTVMGFDSFHFDLVDSFKAAFKIVNEH